MCQKLKVENLVEEEDMEIECVPLNVRRAITVYHSGGERTTSKWVSHGAEHSRRVLVGGSRVTWDSVYTSSTVGEGEWPSVGSGYKKRWIRCKEDIDAGTHVKLPNLPLQEEIRWKGNF